MIAELNIERRLLAELKSHPKNPRVHPDEGSVEFEALRRSLEHDYFDPLVLNTRNGMLVSGHYRKKVFEVMGVTEVDVVLVDYDEPTHLARLFAANKQFGDWDDEAVTRLLGEIDEAGLESWMAGFVSEDWDSVLDVPEHLEDDAEEVAELVSRADELQEKWGVVPGEMFTAGGLSFICGDCTDEKNWVRMLGGEEASMVWTDPPYNVAYEEVQAHRAAASGSKKIKVEALQNDNLSDCDYDLLLSRAFQAASDFTKPGGAIYVAHADGQRIVNQLCAEKAGFMIKQNLVWIKSSFTLGRQDYQWQHEPILYGWKEGAGHFWQGGFSLATVEDEIDFESMGFDELVVLARDLLNARDTSVIREPKGSNTTATIGHPTVKPLPLVARQLWNSSRKGEIVLELFAGSGTTLLAAHHTERRCVATELEPKFCAVILERLVDAGLEITRHEPETNA